MDACSRMGESTDAIVMDDSPTDEREIQEVCQRWVFVIVWFLVLPSFPFGQWEYCSLQLWTIEPSLNRFFLLLFVSLRNYSCSSISCSVIAFCQLPGQVSVVIL